MVTIFKYRLHLFVAAFLVSIACNAQVADNTSFDLMMNNKCDNTVKVQVLSKETSGAYLAERVMAPGETAQVLIDPEAAGDFIQVTNLNSESEIRIYMNNLLQDRLGSPSVAITIENANFSADKPQAVHTEWQR